MTLTATPPDRHATPLQLRFLGLVARGYTNREIGHRLGYAEKTVKNTLSNLFERYGVKSRTQAVLMALTRGDLALPMNLPVRRRREE